jgi:predicted RNA-binding protein YlqC (UPF0109 family)
VRHRIPASVLNLVEMIVRSVVDEPSEVFISGTESRKSFF